MDSSAGFEVVRRADLEWQDRTNVDGWQSRSAVYLRDESLVLRLVEWPAGATEPVHTHPGTHATTVVEGRVVADGVELGPFGVILGFGGQPHGPLHFPDGAYLVSALQDDAGEHLHVDVSDAGVQAQRCAVPTDGAPWVAAGSGAHEERTLVDGVLGRLRVSALRFPPGGRAGAGLQVGLLLEGTAMLDGQRLQRWDLVHAAPGAAGAPGARPGPVDFPDGALLLAWALEPGS